MKIAFCSYGHVRDDDRVPLNSVLLTNHGAWMGCSEVGEVRDYSPIVRSVGGVDWGEMAKIPDRLEPADVLYCQAAVSLPVIHRWKAICPGRPVILQRDSTHARTHYELMKAAMARHDCHWVHTYEGNGFALLNMEEAEYALADKILCLSRWVKSTFDARKFYGKCVQATSQCAEKRWWSPDWTADEPRFTAVFAGQLGLRKGTLDLLEAWRRFYGRFPESQLILAGMPEHGASEDLHRRLDESCSRTPGLVRTGWVHLPMMAQVYAHSHVLVMPSVEDGATMTGVEAALCGRPVIATAHAGIDLLEHGVTGWEIQPLDVDSIVQALVEAASDRGRTRRMGEEIFRRAEHTSDVSVFAHNIAETLRRIIV